MTVCKEWWQENGCGSPCNDVRGQYCFHKVKKTSIIVCHLNLMAHYSIRTPDRRESVVYSNVLHLPIGLYNLRICRFH